MFVGGAIEWPLCSPSPTSPFVGASHERAVGLCGVLPADTFLRTHRVVSMVLARVRFESTIYSLKICYLGED